MNIVPLTFRFLWGNFSRIHIKLLTLAHYRVLHVKEQHRIQRKNTNVHNKQNRLLTYRRPEQTLHCGERK